MADHHPNPWNFHNTDKQLSSASSGYRAVYYELNEMAMGAPLGGTCFLETRDTKVKLHECCGGPPLWEGSGLLLAIPIWIRKAQEGLVQQIGIADSTTMELKIFSKTFRVLDLRSFNGNKILGEDSPRYQTVPLNFDISQEQVETTVKLNE